MAENGKWQNRIIETVQMRVGDLAVNKYNPKRHPASQQARVEAVLEKFGIVDSLIAWQSERNDGQWTIFDGHLRQKLDPDQVWTVHKTSLRDEEVDELVFYFDPLAGMSLHDEARMTALMQDLGDVDGVLGEMLTELAEGVGLVMPDVDLLGVPKDAKPNPRQLPIDLFFTMENYKSQWSPMAYYSGWKWGIQSNEKVLALGYEPHYVVSFVDNVYTDYKHAQHLEAVKRFSPEYATVRDVMSEKQCIDAGIEWYSFGQIMAWAEEIERYSENVIVIPKYDCLEKIPERFILGYSVPTSHGGTPLPVEMFKGRRVHLLGGSWKAQLAHMTQLGDDVVSLDNNYIHKQAEFGSFTFPDGETGKVQELLGFRAFSGATVALAIFLSAIACKVNELFAASQRDLEAHLPEGLAF